MRPMMRLVVGLAALVGILAAVAVGLPPHVTVARSVVTNAPELAVFPYLANLHHFADWSPLAARDPQLQLTYSGPEFGQGRAYRLGQSGEVDRRRQHGNHQRRSQQDA